MTGQLQHIITTTCLCLIVTATSIAAAEKWSRQLESEPSDGVADSFDWIPLAQPVDGSSKDRSGNSRVLTYSQTFPPNARFGDLPKPNGAMATQQQQQQQQQQPQPFDYPFQFQKFLNAPQAQTLRQPVTGSLKSSQLHASQEPTSQSFFKFEMPYRGDGNRPNNGPVQTGYQIQHTFGGGAQATVFSSPLFNQQPTFPHDFHPQKPLQQQFQQRPLHQQNFIDDTLPAKSPFRDSKPTQQALQTVSPQVFPQGDSVFQLNKPTSFQVPSSFAATAPSAPATASTSTGTQQQQQDVQLLYVPYDTLYNQHQPQGPSSSGPAFEVNKFNLNSGLPAVNPYQINQFYTQDPLGSQGETFYSTTTTNRPQTTSLKPSNIFENFASPPQFTTVKPKPKAHQPPLAMFLLRNTARPTQSHVVAALRNANTIAVVDAPTKNTPTIFVGPAGMPIPDGYVKFDLPYLSQLTETRDLHNVPFFVAPLSYRTPSGFNKILLPEPHVGSIVVNRAKDEGFNQQSAPQLQQQPKQQQQQQNVFYSTPNQNDVAYYPPTTQRTRTNIQRVKQPSSTHQYYPDVLRDPAHKTRNQYEVTTQRATLQPSRGNKYSYFQTEDTDEEVSSPKVTKQERPKKKRPQNVRIEQPAYTQPINNPYAQFQPMPNQVINDDFYKVQQNKPSTTSSTSTTTTTTTTTSTTPPPAYFTYNTSPQVEFQSTNGQLYPTINNPPNTTPLDEYVPRFTTRPPPAAAVDEEYRMKQYFRQQEAFRNRPKTVNPTNPPFEEVQYTPVQYDFGTPTTSTQVQKTTSTKPRVTFYTPTAAPVTTYEQTFNTAPPSEPSIEYNRVKDVQHEVQTETNPHANHRPSYNQNEIPEGTVEYDPNPYQLPSELPPLTPNLPGLINGLQDKDKQNTVVHTETTTPLQPETEPPTRPTRRPIHRVRKPVVSKVTSSVTYSESETASRRPSHRIRRPYGTRGSANSAGSSTSDTVESTSTTTRRPAASRNPLIRNPNRIRYQPTPEERQTLRIKPKRKYNGSQKANDDEDLEYQRDVLKQNYPVFKPAGSRRPSNPTSPTSPTAIPNSYAITTTEAPAAETQQVYTVTPSNNIDNEQTFPASILESMQIPQQYNEYSKGNYGPGYFPNQEDLNPTEPVLRNEYHPVYSTIATTSAPTTTTTTATTTTEEPVTTTRRSPFIRRNYPRVRTTTPETPTTTTAEPEERATTRPRLPPRKVIKVRTRNRRPYHPASSTTAAPEESIEKEPKHNYRKSNRYNQNNYENDAPRRRYKNQFQLEGQESQWSPAVKLANRNTFKPVNPKEAAKDNQHKIENEPEIVTANPDDEGSNAKANNSDTYEFNVSANFGPTSGTQTTLKAPNLKPEKSFAELLEEVMGKAPEEKPLEEEQTTTRTTDGTYFESQKTTVNNILNRRGKWKKLRPAVRQNTESFEMAESQNIGTQLYNSLYVGEKRKTESHDIIKDLAATTPMAPVTEMTTTTEGRVTTTELPPTAIDDADMTTPRQFDISTMPTTFVMDNDATESSKLADEEDDAVEENATRRFDEDDLTDGDDLDTQPSLFTEVRKQLHELFAIEENEDQAVTAALAAVGRRRQEYTNIKRTKPEFTVTTAMTPAESTPSATQPSLSEEKQNFYKNLMDHVVYATASSAKVTSETEICYRGRCIRSEDLPSNHKLN